MALSNAPGKRLKTAQLAAATAVPKQYASKVMTVLARRGWAESYRGSGGGFSISGEGENLTLLDVVELFEGQIHLHACTGAIGCQFASRCPAHRIWLEAEAGLFRLLAERRIAELAADSQCQGLFVPEQRAG